MLVQDIVKQVRGIAGDIDVLQFSDDDIIRWINNGSRECAIDNQLLQKRATSTLVVDQGSYVLPTDILKLHSIKVDDERIRITTLDDVEEEDSSTYTGKPSKAYVWAGNIELLPKPDSAYSMAVYYTRQPALVNDLTDDIDLPESYHMRLVDYCLAQVAQQDDDMNRYQVKMQEFRTGVSNLKDQPEWEDNLYPMISYTEDD